MELGVTNQPIFQRDFVGQELDPFSSHSSCGSEWRVLAALEALDPELGEVKDKITHNVLEAYKALSAIPPEIGEATSCLKKVPDEFQVEWYRAVGPLARSSTLAALAQGEPDTLRHFISSGFAVLNFPTEHEIRDASARGFAAAVESFQVNDVDLKELGEKLSKLGALAGFTPAKVWAEISPFVPGVSKSKDAVFLVLLTFPTSTASLEEIVRLPKKFHAPLLHARGSSIDNIPSEVMRGVTLLPNDCCELGRIARELYGNYFGTEVVVEPDEFGLMVGFQRSGLGVQEIGYYRNYLNRGDREAILGTTRHEIDHLETTLLSRTRPDEAFAISSISMIRVNKEDPKRLFPYGRFCRLDELRSYLIDAVKGSKEEMEEATLSGKQIYEVWKEIVPKELNRDYWSFYTDEDVHPGQVVARFVPLYSKEAANFALFIPLPESRGPKHPENHLLLEKALERLNEYLTSMGRFHLGEAASAVAREKERIAALREKKEPFTIRSFYWQHFHDEPSVIEGLAHHHSSSWAKKLSSGDPLQISATVEQIERLFTPPHLVRMVRDKAIKRMVGRPDLISRVQNGMKELAGANYPALEKTRTAVVGAALQALGRGELKTFFNLVESPLLFRSNLFTTDAFFKCGERGAERSARATGIEKNYLHLFRSEGVVRELDDISSHLAQNAAEELIELNELMQSRGEQSRLDRMRYVLSDKGIAWDAHHKDGIIIHPSEEHALGRFAAACFTGGRGMRMVLRANSMPYYDYSKHVLTLGIFPPGDVEEMTVHIQEAMKNASEKLLIRTDSAPEIIEVTVKRTNPESGKTERIIFDLSNPTKLLESGREWAVEIIQQFMNAAHQEGAISVTVSPDGSQGIWELYRAFQCALGRVNLEGTTCLDSVVDHGVPLERLLNLEQVLMSRGGFENGR